MAESHTFIQASEILSMIPTHTLEMNKGETKKELEKLRSTMETIQSVLPDAEKHQDSSQVKNWIESVGGMLNEVHNLFMRHKIPTKKKNPLKEVQLFFSSKLSPFASNDSFSKQVKVIRKRLLEISEAVHSFEFKLVKCHFERPTGETHDFLDPRVIVGRDDDENSILELLFDDVSNVTESVPIIAIASIEGMGKTRIAQLIFNHERVQEQFENRWWTYISSVGHEKQVYGKIYQSISGKTYEKHHSISELQSEISTFLSESGKYLLVLDDVWDDNLVIWSNIMSFFSNTSKGNKIIVTTRFLSVPRVLQKNKCQVYQLDCLSEAKSWELFKLIAITPEKEEDSKWKDLGSEIVKKCANVPLVIKSIASVLCKKSTMQDWENIVNNEKLRSDSSIMSTLEFRYDRLPSKLKSCFSYCALFPKDHIILKQKLIYLWIAQEFVELGNHETLEAAGHAYFMELFRRGFFQEAKVDDNGDILSCKMHSIFCDLAQHVASKSIMLTRGENQFPKKIRHVSFGYEIDTASNVPSSVLDETKKLGSLLTVLGKSCSSLFLDEQVMKFTSLHALDLNALNIEKVPSCIGELIRLRYLNLSENTFPTLPDSITMLANLMALDISCCRHLEALPNDFRKLTNLRHLDMSFCDNLRHMPPRFGELTSLVHLSDFKVSKEGSGGNIKNSSGLDALDRMNLKGKLAITFDYKGAWLRDDTVLQCNHIPKALEQLTISDYPIPTWWKVSQETAGNKVIMSKLQHLVLIRCKLVKHLPPFHGLPVLRILQLYHLHELQYIVLDNKVELFHALEKLELVDLPKLERWSKEENSVEPAPFDHLSHLEIKYCHRLVSMPPSPRLQRLWLEEMRKELVHQLVSASSALQDITINWCIEVKSFPCKGLTKLRKLDIRNCTSLKKLELPPVNGVEDITISNCTDLKLWCYREEEERGVDWPYFTKLRRLNLDKIPAVGTLPDCLQQLTALGKLQINECFQRLDISRVYGYLISSLISFLQFRRDGEFFASLKIKGCNVMLKLKPSPLFSFDWIYQ